MPVSEKEDKHQALYRELMDDTRTVAESYSGFQSYRDKTLGVWVRKAATSERIACDEMDIKRNRILMRCLSRVRAVDYAMSHVSDLEESERQRTRVAIKERFDQFASELEGDPEDELDDDRDQVEEKEKAFNTFLIQQLHAANLTEGCFGTAAAAALLKHYEILSHVLDAALPIVTFKYNKTTQHLEREIQYPVTLKTDEQKKEFEKLKIIKFNPSEDEINAHTRNPLAMQRADACFAELLISDDRALSSAACATHPMGAKDAFVVQRDSLNIQGHAISDVLGKPMADWEHSETHWSLNKGAVAFNGLGETPESGSQYAETSMKQILEQAKFFSGIEAQTLQFIEDEKKDKLLFETPVLGSVKFLKVSNQTALLQFDQKKKRFSEALRALPDTGIAEDLKASGLLLLAEFSTYEPKKKAPKTNLGFFVHKVKQGRKYLKEKVLGGAEAKRSKDLMLMTASIECATDAVEGLTAGGDFNKAVNAIDDMNDMQKRLPGHGRLACKLAAFALILSLAAVVATCIIFPPVFAALLTFAGAVAGMTGGVVNPLVMILTTTLSVSSGLWYAGQTKGKASALKGFNLVVEAERANSDVETDEAGDVFYPTSL